MNAFGAELETPEEFFAELSASLGDASLPMITEDNIKEFSNSMRLTFDVIPKNSHRRLSPFAVKYLLNRFFLQSRGWVISSFDVDNKVRDVASVTSIVEAAGVKALFDRLFTGPGLSLKEVAALAAVLDLLVKEENMLRLQAAYRARGLNLDETLDEAEADRVIYVYMANFILGGNLSNMTQREALELTRDVVELYPGWVQTKNLVRVARRDIVSKRQNITHSDLTRTLSTLEDIFLSQQASECRAIKDQLVALEDGSAGRVPLGNFYREALRSEDSWQFRESVAYLSQLGALDETDVEYPAVLIPNYVHGHSNCISSSAYHTTCCPDECGEVLAHLEHTLGVAYAVPEAIIEAVRTLPAAGDIKLSPTLLRRLDEVAAHHNTYVPLHGRLFAQWLHLLLPRDCPFPHAAGTVRPLTPDEWGRETHQDPLAAVEEMQQYVEESAHRRHTPFEEGKCMLWSMVEELAVPEEASGKNTSISAAVKVCVLIVCLIAMLSSLRKLFGVAVVGLGASETKKKLYV